jgi:DNA-binding response OmpR family regulator
MTTGAGRVLVVEDARINRAILVRALEAQGLEALEAENGRQALEVLGDVNEQRVDVVLLDLEMPELDGYETLRRIRAVDALRHVPVIVISAVDELSSVVRCIEMGAADYLPKPFNAAILRARVSTSLQAKRARDLELEYLEQVARVTDAAVAVESDAFDPVSLQPVASRPDALGQLARTFQAMAVEVRAREERLRAQVRELTIEIDEARQAQRVAEITDTDYFRGLRSRAAELRRIVDAPGAQEG